MSYKKLSEYLKMNWSYNVEQHNDDGCYYLVRVIELPGCQTHGKTPAEAFKTIPEAIESYIASLIEDKLPVPEPLNRSDFKGNISLRIRPESHYKLMIEAKQRGISLNTLIKEKLASWA